MALDWISVHRSQSQKALCYDFYADDKYFIVWFDTTKTGVAINDGVWSIGCTGIENPEDLICQVIPELAHLKVDLQKAIEWLHHHPRSFTWESEEFLNRVSMEES